MTSAEHEIERDGRDLPFESLLVQERWRPLVDFVRSYFSEPLVSARATTQQLDQVEARLGRPLSGAHREALRLLLGRTDVITNLEGETLASLEGIRLHGRRINVIGTSIGSSAFTDDDDPPTGTVGPDGFRDQPLSAYLLVTAIRGNLMRRAHGLGIEGLREGVRGASGVVSAEAVAELYPRLACAQPSPGPLHQHALHGDAETVVLTNVRSPGVWDGEPMPDPRWRAHSTYAMTCSPEAWTRLLEGLGQLTEWGKGDPSSPPSAFRSDSAHDFFDRTGRYRSLD